MELERQSVQTVSASLGEDSLRAGVIAGVVGLVLVALYMLLYYRALGVVMIVGVGISGALLYSIVSWMGETRGLALTLAGVTGIIVSIGVTVDSYVVFFERLKDEVKAGGPCARRPSGRSSAFPILAADISSFLGAAVLWWLTVGSVRGFAFFLGLSTVLDVIVAWFFTRPTVILLSRNRFFTEMPGFGVARGWRPAAPCPARRWLRYRGQGNERQDGRTRRRFGGQRIRRRRGRPEGEKRRSIWTRLYHGETNFDFVGRRKLWFTLSLVAVLIGLGSLVTRGLNLGIDFEGGVVWEVPAGDASVADARNAIDQFGLRGRHDPGARSDEGVELRIEAEPVSANTSDQVTDALAQATGSSADDVSLTSVGPSWGREISDKAIRALIVFLVWSTSTSRCASS